MEQLNRTGSMHLNATINDIGYSKSCAFDRITLFKGNDIYKLGFICSADRSKISKHEEIDESLREIALDVTIRNIQEITITFCDLRLYELPTSCGSPERILNSEILSTQKSYTIYVCEDGYELTGDPKVVSKVVCNNDGKWINDFPICWPKNNCKIPALETDDPNLEIKYNKPIKIKGSLFAEPDSVAHYTCKNSSSGHKIIGQVIRFCKNGLWNSSQPQCSIPNKQEYNKAAETISSEQIETNINDSMDKAKPRHKEYYVIIAMMYSFTCIY